MLTLTFVLSFVSASDKAEIDLSEYPIHVMTSVMKQFLRELPEPLMTYELYDELMRAGGKFFLFVCLFFFFFFFFFFS